MKKDLGSQVIWGDILSIEEKLENSNQLISPPQLKGGRKQANDVLWLSSYFPLSLLTGLIKTVLKMNECKNES